MTRLVTAMKRVLRWMGEGFAAGGSIAYTPPLPDALPVRLSEAFEYYGGPSRCRVVNCPICHEN